MQQQELSDDQQPRSLQHCDCSLERVRAELKAKSQQRLEEERLRAVTAVDQDMEMNLNKGPQDLTILMQQEEQPFDHPPPVGQIFVQEVRKLLVQPCALGCEFDRKAGLSVHHHTEIWNCWCMSSSVTAHPKMPHCGSLEIPPERLDEDCYPKVVLALVVWIASCTLEANWVFATLMCAVWNEGPFD